MNRAALWLSVTGVLSPSPTPSRASTHSDASCPRQPCAPSTLYFAKTPFMTLRPVSMVAHVAPAWKELPWR